MALKVLHIIPSLAKGGAERLALDICKELSRRPSVEVKLIYLHPVNEYQELSKGLQIECVPTSVNLAVLGKSTANVEKLNTAIDHFNPDVIHTHLFEAELVSRWNIKSAVAYFSHAHWNTIELKKPKITSLFSKQGIINWFVYRTMVTKYTSCQNRFITISEHATNYYKENLPEFIDRIHYLPNGIDINSFAVLKDRTINRNKPVKIISVGSLNENKNQLFQIEIAEILRNKGFNFYLNIVGQGKMYDALKKRIEELDLTEQVSLCGISNHINTLYQEADLFLHTSKQESFGLVIVEAMAAGLPVVCFNGGGNKELIDNGKNGYIIQEFNPQMFAEKIIELSQSPEFYSRVSKNAITSVKKYDIAPYVDELLKLYQI